ncbi:MAG TPA: Rieske 2Fe-2S domain-containing protein [Nitriliruptoraceae bacterium]|nr:Rieske 2Fe-2S domain-containing protein [Nitriliruptoraceae bacterium]
MSDERSGLPEVERRTFLRYALFGSVAGGLGVFGLGSLAFLWPGLSGGFGETITIGNAEQILADIRAARAPLEYPSGRLYVVEYDPSAPGADEAYGEIGVEVGDSGLMALYQKCVHLGCRVPWCQSSQWFECPCHGSKYNRWGEWVDGPAPRGLDRFPSSISADGDLQVDTGSVVPGPARTANVLAQEAEGPNCVDL